MTHLPAYNPGNFLMKTMNPTNSGLYCNIVKHVYVKYLPNSKYSRVARPLFFFDIFPDPISRKK